jgi:hypothetical protein
MLPILVNLSPPAAPPIVVAAIGTVSIAAQTITLTVGGKTVTISIPAYTLTVKSN